LSLAIELLISFAIPAAEAASMTGGAMEPGSHNAVAQLRVMHPATRMSGSNGCSSKGGNGKSSCGSSAGQGDLSQKVWEKIKNHPCYSE
jgi:nitrogen fixation protein NifB